MLVGWALRRRAGPARDRARGALALRLAAAVSGGRSSRTTSTATSGTAGADPRVHPNAHPGRPGAGAAAGRGLGADQPPGGPYDLPALAQLLFAHWPPRGWGAGFRLAFGLLDFAVVLALRGLLHRLALPADRLVLYAWNPLAVLETAGSGHLEPLGSSWSSSRWHPS